MKKFARKAIFFTIFYLGFFITINTIFLVIIEITDWDFKKRIESLKFDNPGFELLVIGNSLAEYGIDTELLTAHGMKSYNLALVGNPIMTSYFQLDEYLTKYPQRPRYVLLATNSSIDVLNTSYIQPIVDFTMKDHKYNLKDIPLVKFRWLNREIIKKVLSSRHRHARLSYGQIKWEKSTPDETEYKELNLNIQLFESDRWIGEIARLCKQNGIVLIIIEMPGVRNTQNLSKVGPYTLKFVNGYSTMLYNFNSQDFCKRFDYDRDWIGRSHFNEFGATKFTHEVIKVVGLEKANIEQRR